MNSILFTEFQNMIAQVKKGTISRAEILRIEKIVEFEKKKEVLKSMILFLKKYMDLYSFNNDLECLYVYGGFVRDWCMPCLNEDLDCMDKSSVDIMFERYPDFDSPKDLDLIKKNSFDREAMSDLFLFTEGNCTHTEYDGISNTFHVVAPSGVSFKVDFSNQPNVNFSNGCPYSQDFDVNQWMFNPDRGIYNSFLNQNMVQRNLLKNLIDIKLKRCRFIGLFEPTHSTRIISIRKKYIDRIKKMLSKGWTITNFSPLLSFLLPDEECEDICMICQEKTETNQSRIRISCCSYVSHTDCLLDWVKTNLQTKSFSTCLLCKKEFTPIKQTILY